MFRYNKVINEYEFPPLEVLHYLLITLRLGSGLMTCSPLSPLI